MIPINVDVNASPVHYKDALARKCLLVTKTFYTFQGEGPFAGRPAYFIRLAGCNIGAKQDCPWCDTDFQLSNGRELAVGNLHRMLETRARSAQVIVVTGGEPLLQWDVLAPMITQLNQTAVGNLWQIETNGLLLRESMMSFALENDVHVVVSPKIPHNQPTYRPIPDFWLNESAGQISLKYVVTADAASPYHHLPAAALEAHNSAVLDVYVSGMTVYRRRPWAGEIASIWSDDLIDRDATAANYAYASALALEHGLRVSFQSHLFGVVE